LRRHVAAANRRAIHELSRYAERCAVGGRGGALYNLLKSVVRPVNSRVFSCKIPS
jgi:hypothetical protein